jgi:hypothetical protein
VTDAQLAAVLGDFATLSIGFGKLLELEPSCNCTRRNPNETIQLVIRATEGTIHPHVMVRFMEFLKTEGVARGF